MASTIISFVSQKGGVGKSTLARLTLVEYARRGWNGKIADMDLSQGTSVDWQRRRLHNGWEPQVAVESFRSVKDVMKVANGYDLIIFDGAPHSTLATLEIAKISTLVVIPTGTSLDDLIPTLRLANELVEKEVDRRKIAIAFCRGGDSKAENEEAVKFIEQTGYYLLDGFIPDRTGSRRALDMGKTLMETPYESLNTRAASLVKSIVSRVAELQKEEVKNV